MLSTRNLIWNSKKRWFISEASNHPDLALDVDRGFYLESHVTGKQVYIYQTKELRDNEGELQVTIFKPEDVSLNFEVHILND